jgi:GDP-L-fucose synthase
MHRNPLLIQLRAEVLASRLEALAVVLQDVNDMSLLVGLQTRNFSALGGCLRVRVQGSASFIEGILSSMPPGRNDGDAMAPPLSLADKRVLVTGGAGFLGAPVCRLLEERGAGEVIVPRKLEHDLTEAEAVTSLFDATRPDVVIHLAAEVGGIGANRDNPGRFFYANMAMGLHMVEEARRRDVERFIQVGTVCSYPKFTPVPFSESTLWDGYPEETNAPYGVAKKALLVMLAAYREQYGFPGIFLMPTNLYGPRDNFDPRSSHVIPALILKCEEARLLGESSITCWGTGSASREFLYVDDCASAIVMATEGYNRPEPVNIGVGKEITIRDLVELIAQVTDFTGEIVWDTSKPDGQPRRVLDTTRAEQEFGFSATTSFEDGLRTTVDWFREHLEAGDRVIAG